MQPFLFLKTQHLLLSLCIRSVYTNSLEKIVGGSEVKIESLPYMVSFKISGKHLCGGCIINEWWGVTAAHCITAVRRDPTKPVTVRSGSNDRDIGGSLHKVLSTIIHEKYNPMYNDYDIGLFKVDSPFLYDDTTQPVILMDILSDVDTSWGWISGWGYLLEDIPELPNKLQAVTVPEVGWKQCVRDYRNRYKVTPRQVCYGYEEGMEDACKGDSGGPLVNKDFVLLGITSWGHGCAEEHSPGVYTNALLFRDWICDRVDC